MPHARDITGQRFGLRVVLARAPQGPGTNARWHYRCDCGNEGVTYGHGLKAAASCGCLKGGPIGHGMVGTLTHNSWTSMKSRCDNPNNPDWFRYGGRGIRYCPAWASFEQFWTDMGDRPPGTTLDRKDNEGNYEPSNCRWATHKEQANNRRPPTRSKQP